MPKISVIICSYNRADLLPRAVASVLAQDYRDFELLVIDDASTDDTPTVMARLREVDSRLRYERQEKNQGIAKSRNHGVSLAQGEYIAMLDSDDYWSGSDKLSRQVAMLEADGDIALVGTGIVLVDSQGRELKSDIYAVSDSEIRSRILAKNQFCQSSVLFRKAFFLAVGGYDEKLAVCEDYDLWLKLGQKYRLANLAAPLTRYLIHAGGISKERQREIIAITDRLVERYRKDYPNYCLAKLKSWLRQIKLLIS